MNKEKIPNLIVRKAIDALEAGDKAAWDGLFSATAFMTDDGNRIDLEEFSKNALGHERFTSIDKVENNSLDIYGHFHSDKWGDFRTFFKFQLNEDGKIIRLDIGQAND